MNVKDMEYFVQGLSDRVDWLESNTSSTSNPQNIDFPPNYSKHFSSINNQSHCKVHYYKRNIKDRM
jgi:hypothetical protein